MATIKKPKIVRGKQKEQKKMSGWYEFTNHKNHDLILPKPTIHGKTFIPSKETWEGDDYYFILVRSNLAQLVRKISDNSEEHLNKSVFNTENLNNSTAKEEITIQTPIYNESNETLKEENTMSEKLILDQPDCISNQGKVEHVVINDDSVVVLNNIKPKKKQKKDKLTEQKNKETLLTDIAVDGIQILN